MINNIKIKLNQILYTSGCDLSD